MELLRLRVQGIDFDQGFLTVRSGKGDKDRTTLLPMSVRDDLQAHLQYVHLLFTDDLQQDHANLIQI